MAYPVVCISRVTAAGGEGMGHLVAERLGYRYFDDEVLKLAAEHAGVDPTVLEKAEHHKGLVARLMDALLAPPAEVEGYLKRRPEGYAAHDAPSLAMPPVEELRRLIKDAIVEIARRGQAVIVAHAASMALAVNPEVLRVHVTASRATRVRRLWEANMLVSEEEYAQAIAESDRQRREYLARFYDVHEESPTHYDLIINTDAVRIEAAVGAIIAVAHS
jgi:uncharacterized protein